MEKETLIIKKWKMKPKWSSFITNMKTPLKIKSYRISVEQDKAVRKRAKKSKVTESAIIRNLIDNANQLCPNHTKK